MSVAMPCIEDEKKIGLKPIPYPYPGILDGNRAVNAVPLALEVERDGFVDQRAAVGVDSDSVLKVGDAPGFRGGGKGEGEDGCEKE
jgi:hypothetical protein